MEELGNVFMVIIVIVILSLAFSMVTGSYTNMAFEWIGGELVVYWGGDWEPNQEGFYKVDLSTRYDVEKHQLIPIK